MDIKTYFRIHSKAAVAVSGGTDSAYLLYEAVKYAKEVQAWYFLTPFQHKHEAEDARRLCDHLGVKLNIIKEDVLEQTDVKRNDSQRCYHCKKNMFLRLKQASLEAGFQEVMEGTNASDSPEGRPGYRALQELGILSPLRECELTKGQIRKLSKEAGLFTASKPSNSCLATRIPEGMTITQELLEKVAACENALTDLGFSDFRVRVRKMEQENCALIQVPEDQIQKAAQLYSEVTVRMEGYFQNILLDLRPREGVD